MTQKELSEYEEIAKKVKELMKTSILEDRANIVQVQKSNTESLGDRISNYASEVNYIIPKEEHLIVRIDGHHFSKYTLGFDKPFDTALSNAMIQTTKDLHERFN